MTGDRIKIINWLLTLDDDDLYDIKKHEDKRSLDANAMYWSIVGLIAKNLRVSTAKVHNIMLRRNPIFEEVDGKKVEVILPDTEDAHRKAYEATEYHLFPTSESNGDTRVWLMLKGSHGMNKKEFSQLLDEALSEAQEMGIRIPDYEKNA